MSITSLARAASAALLAVAALTGAAALQINEQAPVVVADAATEPAPVETPSVEPSSAVNDSRWD
ncbi:hypothetical protein [Streptomyces sp. NPDC054863]